MSAENIRRRLVVKLGGKPDAVYIDKIGKFLLQQEEKKKVEIQIITRSKSTPNALIFKFNNGETYELYDYVDPLMDKPKPKDYKPPEIKMREAEVEVVDDGDDTPFTIAHFVLWTLFLGLIFLSAMLAWIIYNFQYEHY
jgi:hypothetical protein